MREKERAVDRVAGGSYRKAVRLRLVALVVGIGLAATPSVARASDADDLFREGVKLLEAGQIERACDALDRSRRLDPAAGTLLNLASCYERMRRGALAWRTFREALVASRARHREDWAETAEERSRALAARLPSLTLAIAEPRPAGLEIKIDDYRLLDEDLGRPVPVEAGMRLVRAEAPGFASFSVKVQAPARVEIALTPQKSGAPPVAPATPEGAPPPTASAPLDRPTRSALPTIGLVTAAVGVVAIGVGGVSLAIASSALDDAKAACPTYPHHCSADAGDPNDRARTYSSVATVAFVAGGLLTVAGLTMWLLPEKRGASSPVGITVGPRGLALEGRL
jgi:hypothetical protein